MLRSVVLIKERLMDWVSKPSPTETTLKESTRMETGMVWELNISQMEIDSKVFMKTVKH